VDNSIFKHKNFELKTPPHFPLVIYTPPRYNNNNMKIFNFLTIFLTTTTIFFPFLVKGQELLPEPLPEPLPVAQFVNPEESLLNCHWFNAVDFQGNQPLTKQDIWQFKDATCTSEVIEKINDTNSTSSFFLIKGWDYGQLLMVFLTILFFFLLIFILVFNFFFEPVFKIRGKK